MPLLRPEVMVRQVERLATDLRELIHPLDEQICRLLSPLEWATIKQVYLTGSGDFFHAACATEMAFDTFADIACQAMSSQRFLDYGSTAIRHTIPYEALVIAASTSGNTPRVVQAIKRARELGALTIALTGTANSMVTQVADRTILVELPHKERSPGIRTYQVSLLGMLLVALRLGEMRNEYQQAEMSVLLQELTTLADVMDATNYAMRERCREVAKLVAHTSTLAMLGSGPGYGTACFCAAKMVEAAGIPAIGQDLEEWWHIERFAYPLDMPVFVIAPPGRSHWRAVDLATAASGLGRRVIAVTHKDEVEVTRHAYAVLSVQGKMREEFSPLLYHLFASYIASYATEYLGRMLFQSDVL